MLKRLITTILFIVISINSYSQNLEPLDLAKKIFDTDNLPHIEKNITGEYKGHPNGQDLSKDLTTKFILLGQTDKKAVVSMTVTDSTGNGIDTYLHFVKDSVWKMNAFRALAMMGVIYHLNKKLKSLTPQQVDDMIKSYKEDTTNKKNILFTSKEEYEYELGNTSLTIGLDDKIIEHFLKNKAEFERIKDSVTKELQSKNNDTESLVELGEALKPDYKKLFISSIRTGGYELGNSINFLIGGIIDNSVGYLYVKNKKDLPEMSPDDVIMLKEIGDGWYIYKTT